MTTLLQDATELADTAALSFVAVVRIPAASFGGAPQGFQVPLFSFGYYEALISSPPALGKFFCYVKADYDASVLPNGSVSMNFLSPPTTPVLCVDSQLHPGIVFLRSSGASTDSPNPSFFVPNQWQVILGSVRIGTGTSHPFRFGTPADENIWGGTGDIRLWIDDFDCSPNDNINDWRTGGGTHFGVFDPPGNTARGFVDLPPFSMSMDGKPVGVPLIPNPPNTAGFLHAIVGDVEWSRLQIWMGQYIDWGVLSNRQVIYRLDEDTERLYPKSAQDAADIFGQPAIWFVRENVSGIEFSENLGTGGEFEIIGAPLEDYSPGPEEEGIEVIVP